MAKVFKHHYMSLRIWHCLVIMIFYTVVFPYSPHSSHPNPLYTYTQTPKLLPCSPISSQSHVLHSIAFVCLCELFPLHNICKLCIRSWHCEEQKCRLQIIWAVNKETALKCAEWPVWTQQYLQTVYCWDAVMSSELQQPEDWSKMGSHTWSSTTCNFFICCLGSAFFKVRAVL